MYDYFYKYPIQGLPRNLFGLHDEDDGTPDDNFIIVTSPDAVPVISSDILEMVTNV